MRRSSVGLVLGLVFATASLARAEEAPAVVAVVIDTSGSLRAADLARTRQLASEMLGALPPGSQVAVFSFDDQPRLVLPRTSSADDVQRALDGARIAGRFTALNDALYDASRYLRDAPSARRAIVLVTDGRDENSALNLDDALKVAQETSIPVYAVGVGRVEERVLRRIAKLTSGEYVAVGGVTGSALADKILALPEAPPSPAAAPGGSAAVPPAPSASPAATAPPVTLAPAPPRASRRVWAIVGVALVVVAAVLATLGLRRRSRPRCPACGRELDGPLSACTFCSSGAGVKPGAGGAVTPASDQMSSTVMARMDLTEEYLEKTVTLSEEPVLTVTSGPASGMVFGLNRASATSLGRAKANDIVLEDVSVSSQHCRIRPEGGRYVVHDLKSTNGTFVNERRVTTQALAEGDVVKLGETYLQFRLNQRRG